MKTTEEMAKIEQKFIDEVMRCTLFGDMSSLKMNVLESLVELIEAQRQEIFELRELFEHFENLANRIDHIAERVDRIDCRK